MKKTRFDWRSYVILYFVLFGLIFARYCYYGFEYYYQLDDYSQYHNYTVYSKSLWDTISSLGMLASRPLAGICDILIWSHLYESMITAVAIISAMYAASALFFHKVFSKHFGTGYLFFIVYALMPLGFEGAYWVSASSRIVVGLFFASASLLFFDEWCDEGKKYNLVLFTVFQFISFCFYEQIVLISGASILIVMLCNARNRSKNRALYGLLMFANAVVYFVITKLAPSGVYGERTSLYLPWQEGYHEKLLTPLLGQLKEVFVSGSQATFGKGLIRGLDLLISEPNIIFTILILALCAALFFVIKKARREEIAFFAEFFSGIFLAIAPIIIFFLIKNPWFSLRNAVPSFCGIALVCDSLFDLIFGRLKRGYIYEAAIVSFFAFLCCTGSVSEIHDYRETTMADTKIASAVADVLKNTEIDNGKSIWLLNVDASYVSDGNFYYHEHNYGVTSSPWALSAAVVAISGRNDIPLVSVVTPISSRNCFAVDKNKIGKSLAFCYTGESFISVSITKADGDTWKVISTSGELLGTMQYSDGGLYLKMK